LSQARDEQHGDEEEPAKLARKGGNLSAARWTEEQRQFAWGLLQAGTKQADTVAALNAKFGLKRTVKGLQLHFMKYKGELEKQSRKKPEAGSKPGTAVVRGADIPAIEVRELIPLAERPWGLTVAAKDAFRALALLRAAGIRVGVEAAA